MQRTKIQNDMMFMLENEIYSDSIIPFLKKELKRKVNLHGKVFLKGGIYCHNLEIEGEDIFIQKSVYSDESIRISGDRQGIVWFNSPVSAAHSILVEDNCKTRVRFTKTIQSKSINLSNTIVYGNIIAENVILKNSVVLGGIFCSEKLEAMNSIIGTYKCRELKQYGNIGVLYPLALSDNDPEMKNEMFIVIPGHGSDNDARNVYHITNDDFYILGEEKGNRHLYSNTLRIFDMKFYQEKMKENLLRLNDNMSKRIEDHEKLKEIYASFDSSYFVFIEKGFEPAGKALHSDFADTGHDTINQYFQRVLDQDSTLTRKVSVESGSENIADQNPDEVSGQSAEELICPSCGRLYQQGYKYCEDCGSELAVAGPDGSEVPEQEETEGKEILIKCHTCGAGITDLNFIFCPDCGASLKNN